MVEKIFIVVGLGYGDEGKGLITDYLCSLDKDALVIRHNGGQQAGHCVVMPDGREHIFSNFGSGTFRSIPTFWSKYCTFSPTYFIEEFSLLNFDSIFYIDYDCPVTTHYEILYNRTFEESLGTKRHGSCGLGFGATIDREIENFMFRFKDLLNPKIVQDKLKHLKEFYRLKINIETSYDFDKFNHIEEDNFFIDSIERLKKLITSKVVVPIDENKILSEGKSWSTIIFEGAQGILLDYNFGKRPNITKSNCTSQNAFEMLKRNNITSPVEIFYVTRCYQTRHGAGYFRDENSNITLINNHTETNVRNRYQGDFKRNYLDINWLNYALECDRSFSGESKKNLIITCLDQFGKDIIPVYINDELCRIHYSDLHKYLETDFHIVKYSFGRTFEDIK